MPAELSISNTRRNELTKRLAQLAAADNAAVPALLANLAPFASFDQWQPTIEELSNNIQKLLTYAEATACFASLEVATGLTQAGDGAATREAAIQAAHAVVVTQALKDALARSLRQFSDNPNELKNSMETALGGR